MGQQDTFRRALPVLSLAVGLAGTILAAITPEGFAGPDAGPSQGGKVSAFVPAIPIPAFLPYPRIEVPLLPSGNGVLPSGWSVKEFAGRADVGLEKVGGAFAVRLTSNRSSFSLHRGLEVDIADYPYLSWAWRVDRLPPRGDGRRSDMDDQAAQLYVVFPGFPAPFQIIGYTWDSTVPAGTVLRSVKNPLVKLIVLRSGPGRVGEWIWECRNVVEDFRQLYKEDPTEVMAIALLANSQNTKSSSESRFASLLFTRERVEFPGKVVVAPVSARSSQ